MRNKDALIEYRNECTLNIKRVKFLKVSEMDISVRLYTILHKHGIESIEDMSNYTSDDIIHWKDIGRRSLEELLSTMKSNGIKFKGE